MIATMWLNSAFNTLKAPFRQGATLTIIAPIVVLIWLLTGVVSYIVLAPRFVGQHMVAPAFITFLLVINLVPALLLLVLWGRRIALRHAARTGIGTNGRLHMRLVSIFSWIAAVPMLLMAISASLLAQYGIQFWFSDNARNILKNASHVAQAYYDEHRQHVAENTTAMAENLRDDLKQLSFTQPLMQQLYAVQVYQRELSESAVIAIDKHGGARTLVVVNPYNRNFDTIMTPALLSELKKGAPLAHGAPVVSQIKADRIEAITPFMPKSNLYLYASRVADKQMLEQTARAQQVLASYDTLVKRARQLQLEFNAALYMISLLIVGLAVYVALQVADRLIAPVNDLVAAANRVSEGDLSARVTGQLPRDEIGTLATTFNTMTARLSEQTDALVGANALLERRRALTEAVLGSVSAGVIAVDPAQHIRIVNDSARALLNSDKLLAAGDPLNHLSPELAAMLTDGEEQGIKTVTVGEGTRTLAVKIVPDEGGHVLTFDDITTQINDQRRAAWADVARRIAHEIKNPLTPIQLAAERLQRRYGKDIVNDQGVFARLTETIVRQVGDLRRIVDEFSSFARIPKPVFREENIVDIVRQAIFLHEVAHPQIKFSFETDSASIPLICDRRQLSQALINIIKNAVEAINEKTNRTKHESISATITHDAQHLIITITDTGIGLPQDRSRLTEPYMTTRAGGTGLGLAIVTKIIEEHAGALSLSDAPRGGTCITLSLDRQKLAERQLKGEATMPESVA